MILSILSICALLIVTQKGRSDAQLARLLVASEVSDKSILSEARDALRNASRGTRFEDHWSVNSPFSSGRLNLYLVDGRSVSARPWVIRFPSLQSNCTSTPGGEVVVCDIALVDEIISRTYSALGGVRAIDYARPTVVRWMLSHELGHLVLGHRGVHFFSEPRGVEKRGLSRIYVQEQYADAYAASKLFDGSNDGRIEGVLIDIASAEVMRQTGTPLYGAGILYDYDKKVHFTKQCSHPVYVVRAYNLLLAAATAQNDAGLKSMLKSFSGLLRDDDSPCPLESPHHGSQ